MYPPEIGRKSTFLELSQQLKTQLKIGIYIG